MPQSPVYTGRQEKGRRGVGAIDATVTRPEFQHRFAILAADETYIGGKRKNMPKSKRKELSGRGAVGKEAVVGTKDRESNKVAARHVQHTDAPYAAGFVAEKTVLGAKVYTDEGGAYDVLDPYFDHERVNHSAGEYVREQAHVNGMESFWSMLKHGYQGTYHKDVPEAPAALHQRVLRPAQRP